MSNPYATWDPSLATDDPDGLPDRRIVPLIEDLRRQGVITLQSCAGHEGSNDGKLWLKGGTRPPVPVDAAPFSAVRHTFSPEDRWEIEWYPENFEKAEVALRFHLIGRRQMTVALPLSPDETATLTAIWPLSWAQWVQLQAVLEAMKPGLVADTP